MVIDTKIAFKNYYANYSHLNYEMEYNINYEYALCAQQFHLELCVF